MINRTDPMINEQHTAAEYQEGHEQRYQRYSGQFVIISVKYIFCRKKSCIFAPSKQLKERMQYEYNSIDRTS